MLQAPVYVRATKLNNPRVQGLLPLYKYGGKEWIRPVPDRSAAELPLEMQMKALVTKVAEITKEGYASGWW